MDIIRIDPLDGLGNATSAQAGDVLTFIFPRTGGEAYDLSQLKLWFTSTITGTANRCILPRDVETLIDTLEVYIGDRLIQRIQNYNQIFRIIADYNRDSQHSESRLLLGNTLPIPHQASSSIYTTDKTQYCMTRWLGLLGCECMFSQDLTLAGQMEVKLTLAPNSVIVALPATATYALTDVHMAVPRVKTQNSQSQSQSQRIRYDDYTSIIQQNSTYQQVTQMGVMGRPDYLMATFLPANYRSRGVDNDTNHQGTSWFFRHGSSTTDFATNLLPNMTWNFSLDGQRLIRYNPPQTHFLEYMAWLFPDGGNSTLATTRSFSVKGLSLLEAANSMWATGVRVLGSPHTSGDDADIDNKPHQVTFESHLAPSQTASSISTSNVTLLIAKSTKSLI